MRYVEETEFTRYPESYPAITEDVVFIGNEAVRHNYSLHLIGCDLKNN